MRIGIFAKTYPGSDPVALLQAAADDGYSCVQFNMACCGLPAMPDEINLKNVAQVTNATGKTGIAITSLSGTYNMIHPDPAVRKIGLHRLKILIENARAMGTTMVTLCTGSRHATDQWRAHPDNQTPEAWADLLTEMAKACTLAEPHGISLGIEPELANVVDSAAKARLLIDTLQSPALKIILDPANLFETDPDPTGIISRAIDLLADRIGMAHAKDRAADGSFTTAGTGVIDFNFFVQTLANAGFDGDIITHGLTAAEAPGVAAYLRSLIR